MASRVLCADHTARHLVLTYLGDLFCKKQKKSQILNLHISFGWLYCITRAAPTDFGLFVYQKENRVWNGWIEIEIPTPSVPVP